MGTALRLPAFALALSLAMHPAAALLAQEEGVMKKDHDAMHDAGAMRLEPPAEGAFTGANGHNAAGTVHLLDAKGKQQLHFTSDFAADKAPDTYVILANGPTPAEGSSATVAKLTKFKGEQIFDLPAGTDPGRYSHVVLWSKKQKKATAQAELHAAGMMKDDAMGKEDGMMGKEGAMMEGDAMEGHDGMMEKDSAMGEQPDSQQH